MTSEAARYRKRTSYPNHNEAGIPGPYTFTFTMATQPSWTGFNYQWSSPPNPYGDDVLDTTYSQLQETHRDRLTKENGQVPVQVLRNHQSVLNSYLAYCGKSVANRIGQEFIGNFISRTAAYVNTVAKNKKGAADRMSILRSWKISVDVVLKAARRQPVGGESPFHRELRAALAKMEESQNSISRNVGLAPYSLCKWVNGAFPKFRGMPGLRRLEAYLGLERGQLENLLPLGQCKQPKTPLGDDKYIARHAVNTKHHYRFKIANLPQEFLDEWSDYLKYKTVEFPVGLKRTVKGRWKVLPIDKVGKKYRAESLIQLPPAHVCTTASRTLRTIRSFLGFLTLPPGNDPSVSGLGLETREIPTLAVFAIPEFVNGFLEFMKARSDFTTHNGHVTVAAFVSSLCRPIEGYLWQQPAFHDKVIQFANGRSWHELCAATKSLCTAWEQSGKGTKSRDPFLPIRNLLKLEDPLTPFKRAIKQMDEAAAACSPGGIHQAVYKRDALLLAMSIANPLRLRTMSLMKHIPPGVSSKYETNLYKTEIGVWRLHFDKDDFKNGESMDADYDAPLPVGLGDRIVDYLTEYRPVLLKRNPDAPWVFPTILGSDSADLGERISKAAMRFIPEVSRLRGHAIRNIVATDFLRRNPGQYTVIAELLHDKLETVLKHYAKHQLESAFKAHEQHLGTFFDA